jgi:hypothetical protein
MISKTKRIDLGIYALVINGSYDLLKLNKILFAFRYRLDIVPLDEFEDRFAAIFDVANGKANAREISVNFIDAKRQNKTIFISKAFYEKLQVHYPGYLSLMQQGYIVLLKTFRVMDLSPGAAVEVDKVRKEILRSYEFIKNFRKCLELTAGRTFELGELFGHIIGQDLIIKYKEPDLPVMAELASPEPDETESMSLHKFLDSKHPKAEYIDLAIQTFLHAQQAADVRLKFIQLLLALEICMNGSFPDPLSQSTARRAAILLSSDKREYARHYLGLAELYEIRNDLIYNDVSGTSRGAKLEEIIHGRVGELEAIIRKVLARLVKMDLIKKDNLLGELNLLLF